MKLRSLHEVLAFLSTNLDRRKGNKILRPYAGQIFDVLLVLFEELARSIAGIVVFGAAADFLLEVSLSFLQELVLLRYGFHI